MDIRRCSIRTYDIFVVRNRRCTIDYHGDRRMLFETTLSGSDTATEGRNAVEELALPIFSNCIVYRRRTACRIRSEFGSIG
jgi:hypothetical protein